MANQYRSVLASGGAGTGGDAVAANVLAGKTFTNDNGFDTGTMVNNGAVSQTLAAGQSYTIPEGYHNGSGTVTAGVSGLIPNSNDHLAIYNGVTYGNGGTVTIPSGQLTGVIWNVNGKSTVTTTSNETLYTSVDGETFTSVSVSANTPLDISAYNYIAISASGTAITVA